MKKAVIFVSYNEDRDLQLFLANCSGDVNVIGYYDSLDGADVEHIEDVINRDIVEE